MSEIYIKRILIDVLPAWVFVKVQYVEDARYMVERTKDFPLSTTFTQMLEDVPNIPSWKLSFSRPLAQGEVI